MECCSSQIFPSFPSFYINTKKDRPISYPFDNRIIRHGPTVYHLLVLPVYIIFINIDSVPNYQYQLIFNYIRVYDIYKDSLSTNDD